jgi:hypothetical protein
MEEDAARDLLARLFAYFLVHYPDRARRRDVLDDWTGTNLGGLGPLLARSGGEAAIVAFAEQIAFVATWLP